MSRRRVLLLFLATGFLASGQSSTARAQARDGDILVPEYTTGSVVNIRGGGNFAGAPRFATGLSNPMSVCQGPGGHIYVTEFTSGQVTIITQGGDFTGAAPFAFNLSGPAALSCTPTQILVSELNPTPAQITDITAGGNYAGIAAFARIQRNPAALLRDTNGRLWASSFNDGVIEITAGGTFTGPYYAPNDLPASRSSIALAQMGSMLLVGNEHTDQIFDVTAGGNLTTRPVFALVDGVIGLRYIPETDQLLAASELDDAIYDITAGGDFRDGDPAFATGVDPFDVSQLAYVNYVECGDGNLDQGEECDDGNQTRGDGCDESCALEPLPVPDAGPGPGMDAGPRMDAGPGPIDAGPRMDAGPGPIDAGPGHDGGASCGIDAGPAADANPGLDRERELEEESGEGCAAATTGTRGWGAGVSVAALLLVLIDNRRRARSHRRS